MGKLRHVGLVVRGCMVVVGLSGGLRSEEHTSELQSQR